MRLTQIIEALLFASDSPLSAADLARVDERLDEDTVEAVVQELRAEYDVSERSFQIYEVAGGFQLLTRPEFVAVLERYDTVAQPSRLSAPALEVLAIIAYRQPLGRAEIEDIRGVGSSGVLRTLQERSLVEPVARGEGLGRPLLYGTTSKFLEHFGFRSLEDLPRSDELPVVLRERPAPVAMSPLTVTPDSPALALPVAVSGPVPTGADETAAAGSTDAAPAETAELSRADDFSATPLRSLEAEDEDTVEYKIAAEARTPDPDTADRMTDQPHADAATSGGSTEDAMTEVGGGAREV